MSGYAPAEKIRGHSFTRSSAGFTIITSGLGFRYTQGPALCFIESYRQGAPRGRVRVAVLFFDQKKLAGFDVVKKTKDIHVPWRPARKFARSVRRDVTTA